MIESSEHDGVRVLTLAHGKVNALDIELLTELTNFVSAAEAEDPSALVLTGTGGIFCAGVDLFRIVDEGVAYLDGFLPALSDALVTLFTFSKPLVVAVNGHAIAGGCIIACTGDLRLGVAGCGRIGIPELRVGVPFPAAAIEVMRFAVGNRVLPKLTFTGATYPTDTAGESGLLDRLVEQDALTQSAIDAALELAALGPAFALTKRLLRRPTAEAIERERQRTDAEVLDAWKAPATQAAIRDYLERTFSG